MSQSKLRFSIEESVWLKKGQEVAEVLSMSLDPEISINEVAGQVYIKGALILRGKYCTENQDGNDSVDGNPLSEGSSYRSLTQLNVTEDGVTELVHRFPVDITIPSYRVEDANQVKVEVESFEYELPNSTCFELSASICIYGIKDEKQRQESHSFEMPKEAENTLAAEHRSAETEEKSEIFTPFQFEARQSGGVPAQPQQNDWNANFNEEAAEVRSEKKTAYEFKAHHEALDDHTMEATFDSLKSMAFSNDDTRNESELETEEDDYSADEPVEEQSDENVEHPNESYSNQEHVQTVQDYEHEEPQSVQNYDGQNGYNYQSPGFQNHHPYQQPNRPYEYNNPYQQQENHYAGYHPQNYAQRPFNEEQHEDQNYNDDPSYEAQSDHQTEDDSQHYGYNPESQHYEEAEEHQEERDDDEPKDENALYLTKMLSGKEDGFSKMRMYILQRGDSLEHICERYDVSLNTLMRMNQIQKEDVSEGQIIYIPVSSR
ncbi:LysM peptidoglycan-binding domain-containing protein [Fictibacillus nanhaiensis]|uniref:LysM peptidoglycan-binding domain-containing protein n=1 Tax=Fictibacillus nanhaiensis TaxID=742169 RepID=UPI001C9867D6|nr:LysM peptidoglycan-binding domain-containing protein [Fictibacillus nanhaiensis]MBY6035304.1 LysM peptidoglycan-binding domain-containing protein [Fictibacillus nanhaiensis]